MILISGNMETVLLHTWEKYKSQSHFLVQIVIVLKTCTETTSTNFWTKYVVHSENRAYKQLMYVRKRAVKTMFYLGGMIMSKRHTVMLEIVTSFGVIWENLSKVQFVNLCEGVGYILNTCSNSVNKEK